MIRVFTLCLKQLFLPMMKKSLWIVLLLLGGLSGSVYAQSEHPVAKAFGAALSQGDISSLSALLDEEVELMHPGETGTFRKQAVTGKLAAFFRQNPPARFMMKHQGSSADGQVYAIGQLTTRSGGNYKVLLRAKSSGGTQYRIFKLDLVQKL
jgi:hypothetical protein